MVSKKQAAKSLLIILGCAVLALTLSALGHCTTTSAKKQSNGLGFLAYTGNPYTYKEGSIVGGSVVDNAVVLRIQPRGTFALFTEDIMFCDANHVSELMGQKTNPVVLTFETVAHRTVQEVGCHRLVSIDEVTKIKGLQ